MTKEYLMETAREYISKYPERLNMFLKEYEADEFDFIKRELEYFENTLSDVKDSEASHDGFSITGIDNFLIAYDLCNEIGWEKFMYSTERKIKFLESKKPAPPQPIDKEQNRTKKVIAETFENMDKKGWRYAFATEQDYNLFTDLLTNFFEYKDYSIPNTAIQLKRTCKTKVAKALGEIHAELSEKPLKSDAEYFKIVQVLNHFKDVSNFDLVKAMQR
jgi:hypothetical protein